MNYDELKDIIAALAAVQSQIEVGEAEHGFGERVTSLTMAADVNEQARFKGKDVTEADFFTFLESEMKKVDEFADSKVKELLKRIEVVEKKAKVGTESAKVPVERREGVRREATEIGDAFLRVEKFANLNFLAFHKILKKHDKSLPIPCRRFYIARLHDQRWMKRDYSKIFVRLSEIHSRLRDEVKGDDAGEAGQAFVRSTTKYWVRTEDISRVKHLILQQLPVFQHDLDALSGDSQLTNSVYFDNSQMELYHGRLDKTPRAIAVRFRWYATMEPHLVFVGRKARHDAWKGR